MSRVLIVDDALDLGRLLKTALSLVDKAMPVVVMPSAEEAMLEASRESIDLLVTDIRLPGMSGLELVKKIRNRLPAVKVIMITGMTDDTLLEQAQALKVDEFLFKPMSIPEFMDAARRCLGMASPEAQKEAVEVEKANIHLSERLVKMRQTLEAMSVMLLDGQGKTLSRVGDFPSPDFTVRWVPVLMNAFNGSARISTMLGQPFPEHVLYFRGTKFNLVLAPLGDLALVVALLPDPEALRVAQVFEELLEVRHDLVKILGDLGVMKPIVVTTSTPQAQAILEGSVKEMETVTEEEVEPLAVDIDALFKNERVKTMPQELNDFWETAAGKLPNTPPGPGALSYDQAKRLGLTPEDKGR